MKIDAEMVLQLRTERGWSQEELAEASDLNLRTIQRIERTAVASLRSKRALASVFDLDIQDLDIQDLDDKESQMSPCPECKSDEVYRSQSLADTTTIGGELLPKLSTSKFSSAKVQPVVCGDCGLLRLFVADESLQKMKSSKHWARV